MDLDYMKNHDQMSERTNKRMNERTHARANKRTDECLKGVIDLPFFSCMILAKSTPPPPPPSPPLPAPTATTIEEYKKKCN